MITLKLGCDTKGIFDRSLIESYDEIVEESTNNYYF